MSTMTLWISAINTMFKINGTLQIDIGIMSKAMIGNTHLPLLYINIAL